MEDLIYGHPAKAKLRSVLIDQDRFVCLVRDKNGKENNCIHPTTCRCLLRATIASNIMLCVAIQLNLEDMVILRLTPRDEMVTPNQFRTASLQGPLNKSPLGKPPLPAPNKLDIKDNIEVNHFFAKVTHTLSRVADIQRWYTAIHSIGRVCGIYTPTWEHFHKRYIMGATLSTLSISQDAFDRDDLISAPIHSLLSSTDIFIGECAEFAHLVSNNNGNG
jgi:hypothetical protein